MSDLALFSSVTTVAALVECLPLDKDIEREHRLIIDVEVTPHIEKHVIDEILG